MAITRTPIIDDDGTGTTGTVIDNAWKTELYNQIDALPGAVYGKWTPVDASGAGLVFSYQDGDWATVGGIVHVWFQVVYPTTANGSPAVIGGLPFVARSVGGGTQGFGTACFWSLAKGASTVQILDPTSGGAKSNTAMSGANVIVSAVYLTDH